MEAHSRGGACPLFRVTPVMHGGRDVTGVFRNEGHAPPLARVVLAPRGIPRLQENASQETAPDLTPAFFQC